MSARVDGPLAPYALRDGDHGGRQYATPPDPLRSPFELDRHRITESTAFRRLEHKTQVFAAAYHDHFRTRLTHTLEVAQIARTLAVALGANETLAEVIALAHDLGHPPFGHAGETALNEAMAAHGGFNHNTHSLRVVEYLEHPFPQFRGLNLTAETRAGLAAHETRYDVPEEALEKTGSGRAGPSVEAQIASVADRVACCCHDLEDAVGAGLLNLEDLEGAELWRSARSALPSGSADLGIHAIRRPVLDRVLDSILSDVVSGSRQALVAYDSPDAVRQAVRPLVVMSPPMEQQVARLEEFLLQRVYRRPEIVAMDGRGKGMVQALFQTYSADPGLLPARFARRITEQGLRRVVCDYIAGMTDRYCQQAFESLDRKQT
jgi:dGTPase